MLSFVRVRRLWIGRGVPPLNLWSYTVDPAHKKKRQYTLFWAPGVFLDAHCGIYTDVEHSGPQFFGLQYSFYKSCQPTALKKAHCSCDYNGCYFSIRAQED